MAYTIKAINKMNEAEIDAAFDAIDMYAEKKAYRAICVRRDQLFVVRMACMAEFEKCVENFYADIENGTFGTRYGSEDNHLRLVLLGERYGWHIPADAR